MIADYPGAIVIEARNYGFRYNGLLIQNFPKAWCLHTPEEPADDWPSTPHYFRDTTAIASTHYFVAFRGDVYQCVPEYEGAYANAVFNKPYPFWAEAGVNLNLQTLSIEIEGFARDIHLTMPRGSAQWNALVRLMADRCQALGIPPEWTIGHYAVASNRSDPGQLDIPAIIEDVKAAMEDDMTPEEHERLVNTENAVARLEAASARNEQGREDIKAMLQELSAVIEAHVTDRSGAHSH